MKFIKSVVWNKQEKELIQTLKRHGGLLKESRPSEDETKTHRRLMTPGPLDQASLLASYRLWSRMLDMCQQTKKDAKKNILIRTAMDLAIKDIRAALGIMELAYQIMSDGEIRTHGVETESTVSNFSVEIQRFLD